MKRLRVGVVGCASIARRHVLPALRSMPEYEIAVIGSRDLDKAREVARLFGGEPVRGYDAIVARDDLDVVYVPLPTGLHAEWVARLIRTGKHVMVDATLGHHL